LPLHGAVIGINAPLAGDHPQHACLRVPPPLHVHTHTCQHNNNKLNPFSHDASGGRSCTTPPPSPQLTPAATLHRTTMEPLTRMSCETSSRTLSQTSRGERVCARAACVRHRTSVVPVWTASHMRVRRVTPSTARNFPCRSHHDHIRRFLGPQHSESFAILRPRMLVVAGNQSLRLELANRQISRNLTANTNDRAKPAQPPRVLTEGPCWSDMSRMNFARQT